MFDFPYGIMFHHLHDLDKHKPGQGSVSADEFEKILLGVGLKRILPAKEWLDRAIRNTLDPQHVCVTFDDSLLCQFDVALPILEKHGLTAFWFVCTKVVRGEVERLEVYRKFRNVFFENFDAFYFDFLKELNRSDWAHVVKKELRNFDPATYLTEYAFYSDNERIFRYMRDQVLGPEKYFQIMDVMVHARVSNIEAFTIELWMNEDQIRTLAKWGHVIGLHSHSHPTNIAALKLDDQLKEYQKNQDILANLTGELPNSVAHPVGIYNTDSLNALAQLGVKIGFRDNPSMGRGTALEMPRVDHMDALRMITNKML